MQDDNKILLQKLGKRIFDIRKSKKLTRDNLCYKNFLDPSNLAKYEKGLVEPKFSTVFKIAKAFDMSLSDFFKDFE